MDPTSRPITDQPPDKIAFNVAGYYDGGYIGPSEISLPIDPQQGQQPDDTRPARLDPEAALARLEALVAACSNPDERSSFCKHKELLLKDLAPPYALFHFVKTEPHLVSSLCNHESLKDRIRKISKNKTALISIYCKMNPLNPEERKFCSDWTVWLEQADQEKTKPDDFVAWGMKKSFVECRDKVRDRRRIAKTFSAQSTDVSNRPVKLSLRETATGASITLQGYKFDISKSAMEQVIAEIKRAAPEGLLDSDNDNDGSDTDA